MFFRLTNAFTRIGPISLVADSAKSPSQYRVKYIIKCPVDSSLPVQDYIAVTLLRIIGHKNVSVFMARRQPYRAASPRQI